MYKLELKKNKKRINSVDDWKEFAPPKNPNVQWKDGRSAKELAKYIINGNGYIPKEIEDILLDLGCNTNSIFYGEPEAITSLAGRGGGRNHDLLLVQENEVVVGIEAKSDESLGNIVYKELFEGVSDNKFTRINSLYNDIYGYDLDSWSEEMKSKLETSFRHFKKSKIKTSDNVKKTEVEKPKKFEI